MTLSLALTEQKEKKQTKLRELAGVQIESSTYGFLSCVQIECSLRNQCKLYMSKKDTLINAKYVQPDFKDCDFFSKIEDWASEEFHQTPKLADSQKRKILAANLVKY